MSDGPPTDLVDGLRSVGFRADHDALAAFLTHAHKSRFAPMQTIEELVAVERRAREATNMAALVAAFKVIGERTSAVVSRLTK